MSKSELIRIFKERGYIHQVTDLEQFDALAATESITAYIGFDCTAKSLHVGSLVQIMMLRLLQKAGHKPIVLMGGGTTRIGDPSGKDEARKLLTDKEIDENKQSLSQTFSKFIQLGNGSSDAVMVDNSEWFLDIKYLDFLREYGRHFSINRMLTFDSVRLRLEREQPLSFLEFNYMLLQAYDFVELYRRYGCRLQCGGSDQWGNIVNGVDLARRMNCPTLFGLTSNLITTASGTKMGKTASGAIWLNQDMLSAYDYWQFWRNTEDADVVRFLKMFTELPLSEIEKLGALKDKEINEAKIILANEATALCHGKEAALEAYETAKKTFEEGSAGGDLPVVEIDNSQVNAGMAVFKLFTLAGLCTSSGEAKRLIQGGGAKLNNQTITDEMQILKRDDFKDNNLKLSMGKKRHAIVKLV
jgi:tyrosyl-tRNA synthetase